MPATRPSSAPGAGAALSRPAGLALLTGLLALALGTILVILGVSAAGLLLPGVYVLDVALVLLAVGGVLAMLAPDA
jgi:hypothetical protein